MDDGDYGRRLGEVIREIRETEGLNQAGFAQRIERAELTVSRWENAKTMPNAADLRRICLAFDVPSELLIRPPAAGESPVAAALRLHRSARRTTAGG